jgi:predicted ATPase
MLKLSQINFKGFKSIGDEQSIPLGDLTVLIGPNGSGKSNFVSFFNLISHLASGGFEKYVLKNGAERLLHFGAKKTESISFTLSFDDENVTDAYTAKLSHALPDRLFVNNEGNPSQTILNFLGGIKVFQFNDTSDTAKIKTRCYENDNAFLRHDASNLAAFLNLIKTKYWKHYDRIVQHIQAIMPQFGDFVLRPVPTDEKSICLDWTDNSGENYIFDVGLISDGSLRFMALATLLLQPKELLPSFIVIDEPELGLHPCAIAELIGMLKIASTNAQVLVATQSPRLLDGVQPEQIIVAEYDERKQQSNFHQLDAAQLSDWLERYSLSELWEKNVIGGKP